MSTTNTEKKAEKKFEKPPNIFTLRYIKKKRRKKEKEQPEVLNKVGEARWRRLGAVASWVAYTVRLEGESEVVPVKKTASRLELSRITKRLKSYLRKKHKLEQRDEKKSTK